MKVEVLLSVLNLDIKNLDKMNITSKCTVINQCDKNGFKKYKNFNIHSYNERGLSKSRNRGLEKSSGDIILLCDDDVTYVDNYEKIVKEEYKKNPQADMIIFNIYSPNRLAKPNKKNKRVRFYNFMRYTSSRITFKRKSIIDNKIRFNELFGSGSIYSHGEDTLFIKDCLNKKLKVYSNTIYIANVKQENSSWFNGYDNNYFFDKGVIFTTVSKKSRYLLILQHLIRHSNEWKDIGFLNAYKYMLSGSKECIKRSK